MLTKKLLTSLEGSGLILISALMFGSYGVFSKLLSGYDVLFQTYVRCFLVTIIMVVFGLWRKQFKKIEREDWPWFATVLIFTTFSIAPIMYAFQHLSIGLASFLFYSSLTICTYVFGLLFFKEQLNGVKLISLLLSFVGMILIFAVNFTSALLVPILLAILNGVASGGEVTFSKKISSKYSVVQINALVFGIIALSHVFLSLFLGEHQDWSLLTTSLPILLVFTIVAIIGMTSVLLGFKLVEPSIGAIVGLTEIVFSVAFGVILYQERLGMTSLIGGALIIVAASLPSVVDILSSRSAKTV